MKQLNVSDEGERGKGKGERHGVICSCPENTCSVVRCSAPNVLFYIKIFSTCSAILTSYDWVSIVVTRPEYAGFAIMRPSFTRAVEFTMNHPPP